MALRHSNRSIPEVIAAPTSEDIINVSPGTYPGGVQLSFWIRTGVFYLMN